MLKIYLCFLTKHLINYFPKNTLWEDTSPKNISSKNTLKQAFILSFNLTVSFDLIWDLV